MKIKYIIPALVIYLGIFIQCKSPEKAPQRPAVESYSNEKVSFDRHSKADAMQGLLKQKIQEVYELSSLRWQTQDDPELDSLLLNQLRSYFDSTSYAFKDIEASLDSSNVFSTKILSLENTTNPDLPDSLNGLKLSVEYLGAKERLIEKREQIISYYTKTDSESGDSLFTFYFMDWKDVTPQSTTDSIE